MAMGNLLATEKPAARSALIELLQRTNDPEVKCDAIRSLGRAQVVDARVPIEEHLEHKDATVRSFAAVALEYLCMKESIEPLLKRVKKESDPTARKNVCRALGKCGGLVANEDAAAALLKVLNGDKQNMVQHAALCCGLLGDGGAARADEARAGGAEDEGPRGAGAIVFTPRTSAPEDDGAGAPEDPRGPARRQRQELRPHGDVILRKESGDFGRAAWWLSGTAMTPPAATTSRRTTAAAGPGAAGSAGPQRPGPADPAGSGRSANIWRSRPGWPGHGPGCRARRGGGRAGRDRRFMPRGTKCANIRRSRPWLPARARPRQGVAV
jgi:hypothetical protein